MRQLGALPHYPDSLAPFGLSEKPDALPQLKYGLFASGNLFRVLGVEPALGRGFRSDEDKVPGRDAVVVLSHDLWVSQFGADPSAIGRKVRLNGTEFTTPRRNRCKVGGYSSFITASICIYNYMAKKNQPAAASSLTRFMARFN